MKKNPSNFMALCNLSLAVKRRTCNLRVVGSNPTWVTFPSIFNLRALWVISPSECLGPNPARAQFVFFFCFAFYCLFVFNLRGSFIKSGPNPTPSLLGSWVQAPPGAQYFSLFIFLRCILFCFYLTRGTYSTYSHDPASVLVVVRPSVVHNTNIFFSETAWPIIAKF